jgi:hypothetical protein
MSGAGPGEGSGRGGGSLGSGVRGGGHGSGSGLTGGFTGGFGSGFTGGFGCGFGGGLMIGGGGCGTPGTTKPRSDFAARWFDDCETSTANHWNARSKMDSSDPPDASTFRRIHHSPPTLTTAYRLRSFRIRAM